MAQRMRAAWRCAGLALLLAFVAALAHAQESKTVRVVVPAPPGGNLDSTARLVAQRVAALTGDAWVIDNRPGGNTVIGMELALRAPADGRTLLYHATSMILVPLMQPLAFSPLDDFAPVVQVSVERYALAVPAASPVTSMKALEQLAATREGGLNCAAPPGVSLVACEQFRERVGGRSTTIPYAGVAQALQATVAGTTDLVFVNFEASLKLMETGRLRGLAVSSRQGLPPPYATWPVFTDGWPDFVAEGISGFYVPASTPPARVRELNREINRALADPEVSNVMRESGQELVGGTPEAFAQALRRSSRRYADVMRRLDVKPR